MASSIVSSINSIMHDVEFLKKSSLISSERSLALIKKLRALRTFLLCPRKLGNDVPLKSDERNDKDKSLGSLMVRIEDAVCNNARKIHPYCLSLEEGCSSEVVRKIDDLLREIESFEEDIDEWYTILSDSSRRSSSTADELLRFAYSIIENILDYGTSRKHYKKLRSEQPIDALLDMLSFLGNLVRFVKLQSVEPPKLDDLLSHFEAVAVDSAHLFAHLLYTCDTCRTCHECDPNDPCDEMWDKWSEKKILMLLEKIKPSDRQVYQTYTQALFSSKLSLQLNTYTGDEDEDPTAVMNDFIGSLLGIFWGRLQGSRNVVSGKDHLQVLYEELRFLNNILEKQPNKVGEKIRHLIGEVICDAAMTIFSLYHMDVKINLQDVLQVIEGIRVEIEDTRIIETDGSHGKGKDVKKSYRTSNSEPSTSSASRTDEVVGSSASKTDEVVGFDDEANSIIDRLKRGSQQLRIVAIVGMPGLGKTTLATKVYNDPAVAYHFPVRAWCTISQAFSKKKALLELLNNIGTELPDRYLTMTEQDLAEALWRQLKRRRYLIFLDDVWDIETWNSLQVSFPDDSNGSRIILTSRLSRVVPQTMLDDTPHFLRQLTVDESWELLQKKLFHGNGCPPALHELGMQIAKNCKGLPLTILIVAGFLTTLEQDGWKEVLESLPSDIISSTEQCMNSLELSYKNLPNYLKPCFLYFGVFPEDQVVSTKGLIWLWVAEGFVQETNPKSIENVGMNYLMDLISRSLVMVVQERSIGGVKTCRVHDLLQAFCMNKAKEENFFHFLKGYDELLAFNEPSNLQRLFIQSMPEHFENSKLFCPKARSLLFFTQREMFLGDWLDISFVARIFKLLRVLDIGQINFGFSFPHAILHLEELRYLAVRGQMEDLPSSIGLLSNLETFIVYPLVRVTYLPNTLWNLRRLRHLHVKVGIYSAGSCLSTNFLVSSRSLEELESFSGLVIASWGSMRKHLRKFPNIRKLKCKLFDDWNGEDLSKIMIPDFLNKLESLHLSPFVGYWYRTEFVLPENLKKLTLSGFELPWSNILTIGKLPNLEVLKLIDKAFLGETWDMEEGDFSKLRFLKLDSLDIVRWTAFDDQLPSLLKLVLERCRRLEEIPSCLGNIPTLELIEVSSCYHSIASVQKIQDVQQEYGNSTLKVLVRSRQEKI